MKIDIIVESCEFGIEYSYSIIYRNMYLDRISKPKKDNI